jgi:hypothetical protein
MPFIQTLASIIVVAIENKRFSQKNLLNKNLIKKKWNLAAEMQKLLFPTNLPNNESY